MKKNPFEKEQSVDGSEPLGLGNAYALYTNPTWFTSYKIIKTFTNPQDEQRDSYWLVANVNMITEEYDITKMKVRDVKNYSFLMAASPNWRKYYAN